MINMNARVYDPSLGRFASADDRPSGSGNGQDWNSYAYVNNGPVSATDPTGHDLISGSDYPCYGCTTYGDGFGGAGISSQHICGSCYSYGTSDGAVVGCHDYNLITIDRGVSASDIENRDRGGGGGSGSDGKSPKSPPPKPDDKNKCPKPTMYIKVRLVFAEDVIRQILSELCTIDFNEA